MKKGICLIDILNATEIRLVKRGLNSNKIISKTKFTGLKVLDIKSENSIPMGDDLSVKISL